MPTAPIRSDGTSPLALVTGASSGIGKAIAARLLETGFRVYGTSRHPGAPGRDPRIHWIQFDGSSMEGINEFLINHSDLLTKIDLLVNNAGSSCFGRADDIPLESTRAQHNLLLEAPVQLVRAVLPGMRNRGRGGIVNVSSLAAEFPLPFMAGYSAGKAGLSSFTQSLILTEAGGGLTLIDFRLGDYRTAFNENMRRHGDTGGAAGRAWNRMEENLKAGPEAEKAARDLVRALARGRSGVVRSGGLFQTVLAPLGARLLPRRWLLAAIGWYYNLRDR